MTTAAHSSAAVPPLDLPRPQVGCSVRPDQALVSSLAAAPDPSVRCAVVTLDRWGRLASAQAMRPLGWEPGRRIRATVLDGLVRLSSTGDDLDGGLVLTVDARGDLRLPAPVRRQVWLSGGDRVLVAAYTRNDLLVVVPPRALERMLAPLLPRTNGVGGESHA